MHQQINLFSLEAAVGGAAASEEYSSGIGPSKRRSTIHFHFRGAELSNRNGFLVFFGQEGKEVFFSSPQHHARPRSTFC